MRAFVFFYLIVGAFSLGDLDADVKRTSSTKSTSTSTARSSSSTIKSPTLSTSSSATRRTSITFSSFRSSTTSALTSATPISTTLSSLTISVTQSSSASRNRCRRSLSGSSSTAPSSSSVSSASTSLSTSSSTGSFSTAPTSPSNSTKRCAPLSGRSLSNSFSSSTNTTNTSSSTGVKQGGLATIPARKVFAHYLVGNTSDADCHTDVDNAVAMGLDGFVLNIGDPTASYIWNTLDSLFGYSAYEYPTIFCFLISMDVKYAVGYGPADYEQYFSYFLDNSVYCTGGAHDYPMITTYTSGGLSNTDWQAWKTSLEQSIYFIPNIDDTEGYYDNADAWWSYWGETVDGLSSWNSAWPYYNGSGGDYPGDVSPDVTVMKGTVTNSKSYMMGLSPLQYKDAYGTDVYRPGSLNLPQRMSNILSMSPAPDYIQIISWNDAPESHYIGNIWPEQNTDPEPALYSNTNVSHAAFQPLINSFKTAYKAGLPASGMTSPDPSLPIGVGALWYKSILQSASCPDDVKPANWDNGTDALNWAFVLSPGYTGYKLKGFSNGVTLGDGVTLQQGLNFGNFTTTRAGRQTLELLDANNNIVMVTTPDGRCVYQGCPDGIYDMNVNVRGMVAYDSSMVLTSCW